MSLYTASRTAENFISLEGLINNRDYSVLYNRTIKYYDIP